jgi:probable rRNA maturation factor
MSNTKTLTRRIRKVLRVAIDIQSALPRAQARAAGVPAQADMRRWAKAALLAAGSNNRAGLSIRIVDEAEMAELNHTYRHKTGTTNVLAFSNALPPELELDLLGDIVICAAVVCHEAETQNKSLQAHWAHMVVHGTLHLLGYDHQHNADTKTMETLEIRTLAELGFSNPYLETDAA